MLTKLKVLKPRRVLRDERPPPVPPAPGPTSVWFFCDSCWAWQPKNIAGCPVCEVPGAVS